MLETIDFEVLLQLDTDKYAEWALSHKEITREEKKKSVIYSIGLREKTFTNYRKAINEIFFKTKYWKAPTYQEKANFPLWRKGAFDRRLIYFNFICEGNSLPLEITLNEENKEIIQSLHRFHNKSLINLYNRWLPEDFYELAELLGVIDYLKFINNKNKPALQERVTNPKKEKAKELTFESWFCDENDIKKCLLALKNVQPAIINTNNEYLLGSHDKGSITAWVSILHKFNYVKQPGNELTAPIINSKIKKLNISGRTLRTPNTKAFKQYLKDLEFHIPRKK